MRFSRRRTLNGRSSTAGFALAHWNGTREVEEQIKTDLKVTIRCIPFGPDEPGQCVITGEPSARRVVFAKSY
jgi:prolyl-tRNA synthetase